MPAFNLGLGLAALGTGLTNGARSAQEYQQQLAAQQQARQDRLNGNAQQQANFDKEMQARNTHPPIDPIEAAKNIYGTLQTLDPNNQEALLSTLSNDPRYAPIAASIRAANSPQGQQATGDYQRWNLPQQSLRLPPPLPTASASTTQPTPQNAPLPLPQPPSQPGQGPALNLPQYNNAPLPLPQRTTGQPIATAPPTAIPLPMRTAQAGRTLDLPTLPQGTPGLTMQGQPEVQGGRFVGLPQPAPDADDLYRQAMIAKTLAETNRIENPTAKPETPSQIAAADKDYQAREQRIANDSMTRDQAHDTIQLNKDFPNKIPLPVPGEPIKDASGNAVGYNPRFELGAKEQSTIDNQQSQITARKASTQSRAAQIADSEKWHAIDEGIKDGGLDLRKLEWQVSSKNPQSPTYVSSGSAKGSAGRQDSILKMIAQIDGKIAEYGKTKTVTDPKNIASQIQIPEYPQGAQAISALQDVITQLQTELKGLPSESRVTPLDPAIYGNVTTNLGAIPGGPTGTPRRTPAQPRASFRHTLPGGSPTAANLNAMSTKDLLRRLLTKVH